MQPDLANQSSHAKFSPSGAHRWMRCPGSLVLEEAITDQPSKYAAEGTVAHELAAETLEGADPEQAIGQVRTVDGFDVEVTKDMVEYVKDYAKLVQEYAHGGALMVEKRVNFSDVIGVPDSFGTSDAIILHEDTITVVDLKYGMGVKVNAEDNEQLQLYALGALDNYGFAGDFTYVTMVIHMPRLNHVSEWTITVDQLRAFGKQARDAAAEVESMFDAPVDLRLEPGEKQCRFCKAKATCPALEKEIDEAVADDFADVHASLIEEDKLAKAMARVELVEQWCKGVRAEVERRLLAGQPVEGYKLVEGRRGNRAWVSETEVESLFKSFRLKQDEMYDYKLINPTKAEKLLKEKFPKRWEKVEALTTRAEGKPSVAPVTDKRPALAVQSVSEDFADL